jgi:hypothetical protein
VGELEIPPRALLRDSFCSNTHSDEEDSLSTPSAKILALLASIILLAGCTSQPSDSEPPTTTSTESSSTTSGTELQAEEVPAAEIESAPPRPGQITLDNLDPYWTPRFAIEMAQAYFAQLPPAGEEYTFVTSPTVPDAELELERRLVKEAQTFFGASFSPSKLTIVMFTNEDQEWAEATLAELGGDFPNRLGDEIEKWTNLGQCNFAFATRDKAGDPIYYECVDTRYFRDKLNYQNPAHEYYHLVQYGLAEVELPLWLTEGSGNFFGATLGFDELDPTGMLARNFVFATSAEFDPNGEGFDSDRIVHWMKNATETDVVDIFKIFEQNPRDRGAYAHYGLGSVATEALVASFGYEAFLDFLDACDEMSPLAAFENAFGVTTEEFYRKLTPYINAIGQWKYEQMFSPTKPDVWPRDLDECESGSPWVVGENQSGKLVYLSCGPDGKLHPQDGAPEIDQETGWPIEE